jgi:hypothetical protein
MPDENDPFVSEFAPSCVIGVRVETGEMQAMPDGRPVAVVYSHTTNPLQPGARSEEIALTRTECLELARRLTTAARAMLKFEKKIKASPTMLNALHLIDRGDWRGIEWQTLDALVSRGLIEPDTDGSDPKLTVAGKKSILV